MNQLSRQRHKWPLAVLPLEQQAANAYLGQTHEASNSRRLSRQDRLHWYLPPRNGQIMKLLDMRLTGAGAEHVLLGEDDRTLTLLRSKTREVCLF